MSSSQATSGNTYNLHSLGWNSFQQLCHTITTEILGQTVESYLDTHDGGRDGAFTGEWVASGQEDLSGPFVIQCKFTSRADYSIRPSDLCDEVDKAARLVERGICRSYLLMTNAGLSGNHAGEITELFKAVGVEYVRILGSTWICRQILENKRLRMLVPRVYGLGDLSQILDERAYAQARYILESMRDDLARVVVTDAYRKSANAINEHGFVLLIGEPASGKTTIASLLSIAALDQWDASILKLDDPGDVATHWNPDEPSQFFWLDDAFGVTQYEESLVRRWNHILPQIQAMLRSGAKIVMTSRDYIYNRAHKHLKDSAFPLLEESQVVIDVHDLSSEEREQILYNHIKLGNQDRSFRTEIKPHLQDVADHPRFIPETARRLGSRFFTKDLFIEATAISRFVEQREQLLQEILQSLDTDSTASLALVYMRNGRLESPIQLRPQERLALERLGGTIGGCVSALDALRGSLVRLSSATGQSAWQFTHPTVGDAYSATLAQNPEHLEIVIRGSEPERLIYEVTCGDMGFENATVVPEALFPLMIERLSDIKNSKAYKSAFLSAFGARGDLHSFLTYRCSKEFLSLYLHNDPDLLREVSHPGLYLSAMPEIPLAKHLQECGLLPEERRKTFVETVSEYALDGEDASALSDKGIRNIFTDDEYDELIQNLQFELLPRLETIWEEWEYNYSPSHSPEEYMEPHLEFLRTLSVEFREDQSALETINHQLWRTEDWIEDNQSESVDENPRQLEEVEATARPESGRSIFDDIDEDDKYEPN